jgi:hypothetical protein
MKSPANIKQKGMPAGGQITVPNLGSILVRQAAPGDKR